MDLRIVIVVNNQVSEEVGSLFGMDSHQRPDLCISSIDTHSILPKDPGSLTYNRGKMGTKL